ncbi:MAG: hypothetical protein HQ538_00760, partial [Parcubacteria group bacterium]|nr:hypothetical protein [Parcubacteria group bacterium]
SGTVDYSNLDTSNAGSANQILSYNGSELEWVTVGDITGVTAGTGLSGGGSNGSVTLNVSGVTSSMITDGTIRSSDLNDNYVDVSGDTMTGALTVNDTLTVSSGVTTVEGNGVIVSTNSSQNGRAVYGNASATGGTGIYGTASNTSGIGVTGTATDSSSGSSLNWGGYFTAAGEEGRAVYGLATGSDASYGGYFQTNGSGAAVYGVVSDSTASAIYGESRDADGNSGYFQGGNFRVNLASGGNFDINNGNLSQAVVTVAAESTTIDISEGNIFITPENSGITEITNLTNPTVGQVVHFIGNGAVGQSTISDASPFFLSGAWAGTLNETLSLVIVTSTRFVEISRSTN